MYRMINTCLRRMDYSEIFQIRYYIYHLRKSLKDLSKNNQTKKLYRGTKVPIEEIERKNKIKGQSFQLNGFILKSGDISIAKGFMNTKMDENLFSRVLIEIEAEDKEMTNYSCIRDFSKFKHEDEHLININTFLKIQNIREII